MPRLTSVNLDHLAAADTIAHDLVRAPEDGEWSTDVRECFALLCLEMARDAALHVLASGGSTEAARAAATRLLGELDSRVTA